MFHIPMVLNEVQKKTIHLERIVCDRNPPMASIGYNWPLTPYVSIWPRTDTTKILIQESQESVKVVGTLIQEMLTNLPIDSEDSLPPSTFFNSIFDSLMENFSSVENMEQK